jgi:hypothetical protein
MMTSSGLKFAQKKYYMAQTNCHASTWDLHGINASQELNISQLGTDLNLLLKLP